VLKKAQDQGLATIEEYLETMGVASIAALEELEGEDGDEEEDNGGIEKNGETGEERDCQPMSTEQTIRRPPSAAPSDGISEPLAVAPLKRMFRSGHL
jgi:hypothetical protein